MKDFLLLGRDALHEFSHARTGLCLLVPCLLWLLFCDQKKALKNGNDPGTTRSIILISAICAVVLSAPGTGFVIQRLLGAQPLSECFIVLPTAVIVAYAILHMLDYLRLPQKKETALLAFTVFLMLAGVSIPWRFSTDGYRLITNSEKIRQEVYEIENIAAGQPVILPADLAGQVGECDCSLQAVYVEDTGFADGFDETDPDDMISAAYQYDMAMFAVNKRWDNAGKFSAYGYKEKARAGDYIVYEYAP